MITPLDQLSYAQTLAAQQNSAPAGDPAQFAQILATSQDQNTGQQAVPASLTFSANTLAAQMSQASQATVDPNTVIAAQIQSNLTAQAAATAATQTPEQAKSQQDSLVLQSLNYHASLAMSQSNIPAFMTFQALINKQMTSMGLIPEKAKAATTAAASTTQTTPTKATAAKTSTRTSAKTAAAPASASQVAASNASSGSSASSQLTDTVLSNASTAGSAAADLASNASTTGSETAALASNAGAGGATATQNQSQNRPDATDPADELDALQAELDALLANLEGDSLDSALDSLASITSKYGSAQAA